MEIICNVGGNAYSIPLTYNSKRGNLYSTLGFYFDSLWYLNEALPSYFRLILFKLFIYVYAYIFGRV